MAIRTIMDDALHSLNEQEAEFVRPKKVKLLQPEVDKEAGNQLSIVVNSGEVGRYSITVS